MKCDKFPAATPIFRPGFRHTVVLRQTRQSADVERGSGSIVSNVRSLFANVDSSFHCFSLWSFSRGYGQHEVGVFAGVHVVQLHVCVCVSHSLCCTFLFCLCTSISALHAHYLFDIHKTEQHAFAVLCRCVSTKAGFLEEWLGTTEVIISQHGGLWMVRFKELKRTEITKEYRLILCQNLYLITEWKQAGKNILNITFTLPQIAYFC